MRRILICIHIKQKIYHVSEYRHKDWFRAGRVITMRPHINPCKEPIAKVGFWFNLFVGQSKSVSYRETIFRSLYARQFSLSGSGSGFHTPQGTGCQSVSGVRVFFAFAGGPGHPRRGYII